MQTWRPWMIVVAVLLGGSARAVEEDPCAGLELGDTCIRVNGEEGSCVPDPVRGGLTCGERLPDNNPPPVVVGGDDGSGGGGSGGDDDGESNEAEGCDHTRGGGLLLAGLALLLRRSRRVVGDTR